MARADPLPAPERLDRTGLLQGLGAYGIWGLLPLFFWLLDRVDAGEVVAMRVLWSVALLGALILVLRRGPALVAALRSRRAMGFLAMSAALISVNWLVYVWAVQHHHVMEASLGYFLNPLVNVLIGVVLLRERLGVAQIIAVALAGLGVAVLAAGAGQGIWISLTLAFTFGFYGLVRKIAPVESLEGLAIETAILAPIAAGYLFWLSSHAGLGFGQTPLWTTALTVSGIVTATPLLLFAAAARRLPYSTLGLLQYLAPTMQFVLAITFFGETMTMAHAICFALIWTGLAVYAVGGIIAARRGRAAVAAVVPAR
ncbi:EamA family transporter RarD [Sphingomonas sp. BT-65]|uniref:EamA family transporter RarD n=1 Tax=Sphingomonas sp. BT-65 TaxID=2989821 RepID=UPI0022356775|nr:EamA family transporter RarD [Sphingomonas sp. BT-65]MCW4463067.1 EamA family transporter RarD [Sphingomonas sp. BT-65]